LVDEERVRIVRKYYAANPILIAARPRIVEGCVYVVEWGVYM